LAALLLFIVAPSAHGDAASCRTGQLDRRVKEVPDRLQRGVFAEPQQFIGPLVQWLLQGAADDFQKVKLLHDWLAENIAYDVDAFLGGAKAGTAWEETLRQRKSVCHGYSNLLAKMCQAANIPCAVISGYGRGYGFGRGAAENTGSVNHAWNAVQVQGRWHLVDATWDAGYVDGRTFHKRYSTAYLFPEPRQFLHTHFPTDPRWQLLALPLTAEQFSRLPYLPGRFFEQGLRLITPLERFHPVGDAVQFSIETPPNVVLTSELLPQAGDPEAKKEQRTLVRREGTRSDILVTFPKAGRWSVQVFGKSRHDPGNYWQVAAVEFESSRGTAWLFPKTFSSVSAMDACLYSPLYVPLANGKPQEFKIRVQGAEQVHLLLDKQWVPMERVAGEKDLYRTTATVAQGQAVRIMAKEPGKDKQHWGVVDFASPR
jgi:hypothetical protein